RWHLAHYCHYSAARVPHLAQGLASLSDPSVVQPLPAAAGAAARQAHLRDQVAGGAARADRSLNPNRGRTGGQQGQRSRQPVAGWALNSTTPMACWPWRRSAALSSWSGSLRSTRGSTVSRALSSRSPDEVQRRQSVGSILSLPRREELSRSRPLG